jgi:V8-like Glu-specific endopeptidase
MYDPSIYSDPTRCDLRGKLHKIDDFKISYAIQTVKGLSGSPVLAQYKDDSPFVVGIHTHAGDPCSIGINMGLYFSDEILLRLKKKEEAIRFKYEGFEPIKYY